MGWITLEQARSGAGTTESSNAAAKLIATWLRGINASYVVSHDHPTVTTYSRDGIAFQQEKDVHVREYRGLAQDLAEFLSRWLGEDTTRTWPMFGLDALGNTHEVDATYGAPSSTRAQTLYYKAGDAGSWKSVTNIATLLGSNFYPPTDGKTVEVSAQRANAADGWMARVTTTTFVAPNYASNATNVVRGINLSFIPFPTNESQNGAVVSKSQTKTFVTYDGTTPVYQTVETVTREYRNLTLAQATSKIDSETVSRSKTIDVKVVVSWGTAGTTYKNVTVRGGGTNGTTAATDKEATSRAQGGGLYTVTVTEITYQVVNS